MAAAAAARTRAATRATTARRVWTATKRFPSFWTRRTRSRLRRKKNDASERSRRRRERLRRKDWKRNRQRTKSEPNSSRKMPVRDTSDLEKRGEERMRPRHFHIKRRRACDMNAR